jgi:hypothetical protein
LERQCRGTKRDGSRCTATVNPPQTYCWWHDPAHKAQRAEAASKGGKAKAGTEIRTLKEEVKRLIQSVRDDEIQTPTASVMLQGYRVLVTFLELERKQAEVDELTDELRRVKDKLGIV